MDEKTFTKLPVVFSGMFGSGPSTYGRGEALGAGWIEQVAKPLPLLKLVT